MGTEEAAGRAEKGGPRKQLLHRMMDSERDSGVAEGNYYFQGLSGHQWSSLRESFG